MEIILDLTKDEILVLTMSLLHFREKADEKSILKLDNTDRAIVSCDDKIVEAIKKANKSND